MHTFSLMPYCKMILKFMAVSTHIHIWTPSYFMKVQIQDCKDSICLCTERNYVMLKIDTELNI